MSEPTLQHGGCHCGAVRYQVTIDLSAPVIQCNCSMCSRAATLLAFVPEASFKLEKGDDQLTDYLFNKHAIHHVFCKICGIKSFARGSGSHGPTVAINTRCLDDVDPTKLVIKDFDGRKS